MQRTLLIKTAFLGATAILTTSAFAEDSCCKDGCATKPAEPAAYGLTGDWGGVRTKLKDNGYEFNGGYAAELFSNIKGGKKRSAVFDGLLKLSLDVDLEKAAGWHDATFRISGLYPHGTSGTQRNVGDASIYSNLDSFDTYRLVDFWIEQKFPTLKLTVKVGQMRVDDEFGVTDTAGLFINSSFGVPNPAITPMPIATYPVGSLGVRLRVEPIEGLYGMGGIYDGNSSSGDFADPSNNELGTSKRHGTDWALRRSEGALLAGEIGYQRANCDYPGAVRLGFLHHTDAFADVASGQRNAHSSSTSSYYVLDQTIWQKSKEGLAGFLRGTMAPKGSSYMDRTTQVGLVFSGLVHEQDKVGLAYARNHFSPNQTDAPVGGLTKTREAITELSYQFPVQPYLRVQPDLQYISRPGGTERYNNAWVIGVRAILDF